MKQLHRRVTISKKSSTRRKAFTKIIFFCIATFIIAFPQISFSQSFQGYLGPGDAFQSRDGVSPSYPKYWEWQNFRLDPNRLYICTVYSTEFLPQIWIDFIDERGYFQGTPRGINNWRRPDGNWCAAVQFQPLYNTYITSIGVTSTLDSRNGPPPRGNYTVICDNKPAPPPPPPPPPQPQPPQPQPPQPPPCLTPPILALDSQPSFKLVEPLFGDSSWFKHGDRYWNGNSYIIKNGEDLLQYDNCHKFQKTYKYISTQTRSDGLKETSGYIMDQNGNRIDKGWGWHAIWLR